jgi:DNA-binding response OmpR family regulator
MSAQVEKARPELATHRVLLVEDDLDIATLLGALLRKRGHAVEIAPDAASALDIAPRFRPTLALIDLGLPEMDGHELARRFQSDKDLRSIRLVAVTGYGQEAERKRALAAGFSEYLTKPVGFERLCEVVEALATRRQEARHLSTTREGRR